MIYLLHTLAQAEPLPPEPTSPIEEVVEPQAVVEPHTVVEFSTSAASPPSVTPPPPNNPWLDLVPHVRARGKRTAFALGFGALLLTGLASGLRLVNRRLTSSGTLPTAVRTSEILLRLLVVFLGLGAFGALIPASLAPVLPVIVLAGAVAIGWSARDITRDLIAGLFIAIEGQLRAGFWVSGKHYSGSVEALGLRVTWLRDVHGQRIVVPNHILLAQPLVTDDKPWPRILFKVALPYEASTQTLRKALEEAILLSPWVAPEPEIQVHPDALEASIWHVAVRVLDSSFAHRLQGLLRERVEEILDT